MNPPREVKAVGTRNDNDSSYVRWSFSGATDGSDLIAVDAVSTILAESLSTFIGNVGEGDIPSFDDTDIHTTSILD